MGHLTDTESNYNPSLADQANGPFPSTVSNFGTIVALRAGILVVSNYRPNDCSETSLFVYEYDPTHKNKWNLIQTNLLSTEGQRRHFGSHVALTADGEGLFVGCHSEVNPTELLFYRRNARTDACNNRIFQLQQIITVQEGACSISDFRVDGKNDSFILGMMELNRVYVYQRWYDLSTMEDRGWKMVCKVDNDNRSSHHQDIEMFGANVGLSGDNVLVGSRNNVYSYSLEGWKTNKKASKMTNKQSSLNGMKSSFIRTISPMRFRRCP